MRIQVAIVCALQVCGIATAGQRDYQCEVLGLASVDDDGRVRLTSGKSVLGRRFAVDRRTGAVVGDAITPWGVPTVIASGSSDNAFQVQWTESAGGVGGVHFAVFSVKEYEKSESKSFAYFSGHTLVSGLCH